MKYNCVLIPQVEGVSESLVNVANEISANFNPTYLLKSASASKCSMPHISVIQFSSEAEKKIDLELIWSHVLATWYEVVKEEHQCQIVSKINYKYDVNGAFSGTTWSEILIDKSQDPWLQMFQDKLQSKLDPIGVKCSNALGVHWSPHFTLFNVRENLLNADVKLIYEIPEKYKDNLKTISVRPALGKANDHWELESLLYSTTKNMLCDDFMHHITQWEKQGEYNHILRAGATAVLETFHNNFPSIYCHMSASAFYLGDYSAAEDHARNGQTLAAEYGLHESCIRGLYLRSAACRGQLKFDDAIHWIAKAREVYNINTINNPQLFVKILFNELAVYTDNSLGKTPPPELIETILAIYKKDLNEPLEASRVLIRMANYYIHQIPADIAQASAYLDSVDVSLKTNRCRILGHYWLAAGRVAQAKEQFAIAQQAFETALSIAKELGATADLTRAQLAIEMLSSLLPMSTLVVTTETALHVDALTAPPIIPHFIFSKNRGTSPEDSRKNVRDNQDDPMKNKPM